MSLEDHFAGDDVFQGWVRSIEPRIRSEFSAWAHRLQLIQLCGDERISLAVFSLAGDDSLQWMDRSLPVLEGLSARECLASEAGLRRLKESLLRSGELFG